MVRGGMRGDDQQQSHVFSYLSPEVLIKLFGAIPEAWKAKVNSAITTQCPDPNHPVPGTCTMHSSSVDLSVTLAALKKTGPPRAPIFLPTPNHSHVVDDNLVRTGAIWVGS